MADVNLVIKFKHRDKPLTIPFRDLKSLDGFTTGYINDNDLLRELERMFNVDLAHFEFERMYITYHYKSIYNKKMMDYLPVMYMEDKFDFEDLKRVYGNYYKEDKSRIKKTYNGIKHVKSNAILAFLYDNADISDRDIELAVLSFLDGSYKKSRDAYFLVKGKGYRVKRVKDFKEETLDRTDFRKYDVQDEYMASLASYGMQGYEEHARAMDELAGYDMDEVRHGMVNGSYGLFDGEGVADKKATLRKLKDDLLSLEALSGMSMDELMKLVRNYHDDYEDGSGRRKK